jgi:hypothetical protein
MHMDGTTPRRHDKDPDKRRMPGRGEMLFISALGNACLSSCWGGAIMHGPSSDTNANLVPLHVM